MFKKRFAAFSSDYQYKAFASLKLETGWEEVFLNCFPLVSLNPIAKSLATTSCCIVQCTLYSIIASKTLDSGLANTSRATKPNVFLSKMQVDWSTSNSGRLGLNHLGGERERVLTH